MGRRGVQLGLRVLLILALYQSFWWSHRSLQYRVGYGEATPTKLYRARLDLFRSLDELAHPSVCVGFTSEHDPRDWPRKDHLFGLRFALSPACVEDLEVLRARGEPDPEYVVHYQRAEVEVPIHPRLRVVWNWIPEPQEVDLSGYRKLRDLGPEVSLWRRTASP